MANTIHELTDDEFWDDFSNRCHWLFYGDLDEQFTSFVQTVFAGMTRPHGSWSFSPWGFGDIPMTPDFAVAYWQFLSELVALDFAEYGTSPRGAWLTPAGERFKRIFEERIVTGVWEWCPREPPPYPEIPSRP